MEPGTIWLLVTAALVLFMTPGLAFFYGGLVKAKSVVSMMMLSFGAMGLVFVLWILYGNNLGTLSGEGIGLLVGTPFSDFGLTTTAQEAPADLAGIAFGSTFAVITTALISGAVADRARFFPWMLFAGLWATIVSFPSQGWVWGGGWIEQFEVGGRAVMDWAGGTVVHISAGAAALALAIVLGQRRVGFSKEDSAPHNVPLVLIGAAVLWFGWFGFNAGAAEDDGSGAIIFLNTIAAPAAGIIGFIVVEHFKDGKATAVGAASGVVAGLVAITPACFNLTPLAAIVLGLIAGAVCAFAIDLKFKLGFDDSLDVVGLHLVAGFIGCIYLGFVSWEPNGDGVALQGGGSGLLNGGGIDQLIVQAVPAVVVAVYSFVISYALGKLIDAMIGFRAKEEDEIAGIDLALHGEGYKFD